jgi:hypothetical protein
MVKRTTIKVMADASIHRRVRDLPRLIAQAAVVVAVAIVGCMLVRPHHPEPKSDLCSSLILVDHFVQADLVITGTAFLVLPSGAESAKVLISPTSLYKGNIPAGGIEITAKQDTAVLGSETFGELHFVSGQPPYLLFLQQRADGLFNTSRCMGSRSLGTGLTPEEKIVLGAGQIVNQL